MWRRLVLRRARGLTRCVRELDHAPRTRLTTSRATGAIPAIVRLVHPVHLLLAAKWTYVTKRVVRPRIMKGVRTLIVRMDTGNSNWSYCRIPGELHKFDHRVPSSTIAKTLKDHDILPSPDRPTSWRTFLRARAEAIATADFFNAEVWAARGPVRTPCDRVWSFLLTAGRDGPNMKVCCPPTTRHLLGQWV